MKKIDVCMCAYWKSKINIFFAFAVPHSDHLPQLDKEKVTTYCSPQIQSHSFKSYRMQLNMFL